MCETEAAAAAASSCLMYVPVDVIKERLQVSHRIVRPRCLLFPRQLD